MPKLQQQKKAARPIPIKKELTTRGKQQQKQNLERKLKQEVEQTQRASKPWSWHFTQMGQWLLASSSVLLGLSYLPMIVARPLGGYSASRTDHTSSELMREARRLQACTNNTYAGVQLLASQGSQLQLINNGDNLIAAYIAPTQTAYPGVYAQAFDVNNQALFPRKQVDTGTWTKENPFLIKTETGVIVCWNTLTADRDVFCAPYTNEFQTNGTTQRVNYFSGYQQQNPRGRARYGGGFEVVFQSDGIDNNTTHYQMCLRGYQADNVTPIGTSGTGAELLASTVVNSMNINGQVINQKDNSGAVLWQRKLGGSPNYQMVIRRYNNSTSARAFIDIVEEVISLLGYDCVNAQVATIKDVNDDILGYKLAFLSSPIGNGYYTIYIVDIDADFNVIGSPLQVAPSITCGSGATFGMMPLEDGGVRIEMFTGVAGPGPQTVIIKLFSNNTEDGDPLYVDPKTSQSQLGPAITPRSNDRYTVGYQCDSGLCSQTYSAGPHINVPNNMTLPEPTSNQAVNFLGFSVEKVTYSRDSITVTISADSNIVSALDTNAVLPANANKTYSNSNGVSTLTITATGSDCEFVMNNLIGCLNGNVKAYQRDAFSLNATVTDSSGLPAYKASVPVYITTTDYTPTLSSKLFIGQNSWGSFELNVTTVDDAPPDQITVYVTNLFPSAALVHRINETTGAIVQADISQFTLLEHMQGKIKPKASDTGDIPGFQLSARAYNSPASTPLPTFVRYFETQQVLIHQINYVAKKDGDVSPLFMDDTNFLTQDKNIPPEQQTYKLIYGNNPIGTLARKDNCNVRITEYTQADVNARTEICFTPGDGNDDIYMYTDNGYTVTVPVPINYKHSVLQQTVDKNTGKSATSQSLTVVKAVGGTIVGLLGTRWIANKTRDLKNCFANMVYKEGSLSYWNFVFTDGDAYQRVINKLVEQAGLKDQVDTLVGEYTSHWCFGGTAGSELSEIAKIFAKELKNYLVVGDSDWKEYCKHLPTHMYYAVMGTPLQAALLDFEADENDGLAKNAATISLLARKISDAYAQFKCPPIQEQQSTPNVFKRMKTMGNMFGGADSPPGSSSSASSDSQVSIRLETFTPSKPRFGSSNSK